MAYIYAHYTQNTDELFYIGKGTGDRAWDKWKRNPYWKNKVKKHGLVVKILHDNLTEEEAFNKEKELIAEVGLENLTNLVEGGKGFTSEESKRLHEKLKQDPEYRRKQKEGAARNGQDPEWRRKNKEAMQKVTQDPEWRRKNKEGREKLAQDPEYRRKHKEAREKLAQDPEYRRKHKEAMQKLAQDPEWRRKNKEQMQKVTQDPEWIRKVKESSERLKKEYSFIAPDGTIHHIRGLCAFCNVHNLHTSSMAQVSKGTQNHHKGWKKYTPPTDIHDEFFDF